MDNKGKTINKNNKQRPDGMEIAREAAAIIRKTGRTESAPEIDGELNADIGGSYTGTPLGGGKPEQDADDL